MPMGVDCSIGSYGLKKLVFHVPKYTAKMKTHMNLKLPAADCLICQDLCERDGKTISEEPLTCLTLHIQSCEQRHPLFNTIHVKCATM